MNTLAVLLDLLGMADRAVHGGNHRFTRTLQGRIRSRVALGATDPGVGRAKKLDRVHDGNLVSTVSPLRIMAGQAIAIADAFSDALGIHVSEESESSHTTREIWTSTLATFFSKLIFALTFLIPVILLDLPTAVTVSIIWGAIVMCVLSFVLARQQGKKPWKVIAEHLLIVAVVVVLTHQAGHWIATICANL